jgi:4-hydroxy-tetrahydrodipicolinate synthase
MCQSAIAGDREKAEEIDGTLSGLHKWLFVEANPIPAKWAVARLGLIEEGIRLPLTWLSEQYVDNVESAMMKAGVL